MRKTLRYSVGAVLGMLALALGLLLPALTASAATTYTKNGTYQFAASSSTVNASNEISNTPLGYTDASEALTASGVQITLTGGADAGVVVPLGRLNSLFNADGKFVPPAIVGSNLEGYNLYFDTSASDTYLGYPGGSATYLDQGSGDSPPYGGTNKAAMGAINNTSDTASFDTVWAGQNDSVIPAGTGTLTMEQVHHLFKSNPNGDTNPLVWAWIGAGDGVTNNAVPSYVTSVDGTSLVTTTVTTPPACTPAGASHNFVSPGTTPFYLGVPNTPAAGSAAELKPTENATTDLSRCTFGGYTELTVKAGSVTYALTSTDNAAGGDVTLEPATQSAGQLWTVAGTSQQTFQNKATGLYLRVRNGGPEMYQTVSTGKSATAWSQAGVTAADVPQSIIGD